MECKLTSTSEPRRQAAFTLAEMMVATAIGMLLMTAVASLTVYTSRSFASMANYVELDQYNRKTLDRVTAEIRQADALTSFSATNLVFSYGGVTNGLTYAYDAAAGTLVRTKGAEVETLLKGVDMMTFVVYGHGTISNSFDQFPTTNAANAKLIKLDWTCSRTMLGRKWSTESIQSAKVVMRKS